MVEKIKLTSVQILREQIAKTRKELPPYLTKSDLVKLLPHSESKIDNMLRKYDYPKADPNDVIPNRKTGGRRFIPRDWFLAWYFGEPDKKKVIEDEYEVNI